VQVLSLDVAQTSSNDSHRAGSISPSHLMTEIDPVSVNLCFKEIKMTRNMKNNSHVYC
jgi:hypothetical protein